MTPTASAAWALVNRLRTELYEPRCLAEALEGATDEERDAVVRVLERAAENRRLKAATRTLLDVIGAR
jgi:hypothetical protein